jgi:hypothetical protein
MLEIKFIDIFVEDDNFMKVCWRYYSYVNTEMSIKILIFLLICIRKYRKANYKATHIWHRSHDFSILVTLNVDTADYSGYWPM